MGEIRDGLGRVLQQHECPPRSDMARAFTSVVKLAEGPWQFAYDDRQVSVAIRFCPFCGVDLGGPYLTTVVPPVMRQ